MTAFYDWSTQDVWLPGAWSDGAWSKGAWSHGAWHLKHEGLPWIDFTDSDDSQFIPLLGL
jgi:hypothetical protein